MKQLEPDETSLIIRTKDPTFSYKCKRHNISYMQDQDEEGYDVYLIQGKIENINDLVNEIKEKDSMNGGE